MLSERATAFGLLTNKQIIASKFKKLRRHAPSPMPSASSGLQKKREPHFAALARNLVDARSARL